MKLSSVFSNGLVLQRNRENRIWGYSEPGRDIVIKLSGAGSEIDEEKATIADDKGYFEATLGERKAGGPYILCISDSENVIEIEDVMFGEVFLLLGQSNMELPVNRTIDLYEDYLKRIDNRLIREFAVPQEYDFHGPVDDIYKGKWKYATQDEVYDFSAIGYFFAERMQTDERIAIGLYQTGVGGIQIEALISEERIRAAAEVLKKRAFERGQTKDKNCSCNKNHYCKFCIEEKMDNDRDDSYIKEQTLLETSETLDFMRWLNGNDEGKLNCWQKKGSLYSDNEVKKYLKVPMLWKDIEDDQSLKDVRGSVWVLRHFNVSPTMAGKEAKLKFGTIIDADDTYINGIKVGGTDYRYPPRRYRIKKGILKAGDNVLVSRVIALARSGGFVTDMPYYVKIEDEIIPIDGDYEYRKGADHIRLKNGEVYNLPDSTFYLYRPYGMYNKMIYPLRNINVRAFLFYQGESNTAFYEDYELLMNEMTDGLRDLFGKNVPLLYFELPFYGQEEEEKDTDNWNQMRQVQEKCRSIDKSLMVDIFDLGEENDIHPQAKREAAYRLYDAYRESVLFDI